MDSITVKVDDFLAKLQEIKKDGLNYVTFDFVEGEGNEPDFISFGAFKGYNSPDCIDYEEIDAVKVKK